MESQKRQEEWIQNVSTNITFIDYGNSCVGHRKAGFQIKIAVHFGMADYGDGFRPHAFAVMNQETLDAGWYQIVVHVLECAVGLMIGTELVWNKIKRSGKSIVITTLTQSLGTFFVVSLVFGVVFYLSDILVYLAFILEESRWRLRRRRHYRSSESLTQKDRLPEH